MRAAKTSPAKRKETIMKLRHMSATVDYVDSITLKLEDGRNIHLENAYVLTSYAFASGIVTGIEPLKRR